MGQSVSALALYRSSRAKLLTTHAFVYPWHQTSAEVVRAGSSFFPHLTTRSHQLALSTLAMCETFDDPLKKTPEQSLEPLQRLHS